MKVPSTTIKNIHVITRYFSATPKSTSLLLCLKIVPIVAKTIREDGETQFIDVDCDPSKTLLIPLIPKTPIQRTIFISSVCLVIDSCGGKGICGQCLINLPEDIYKRMDNPSEEEKLTIMTNLDPPKLYYYSTFLN